MELKNIYRIKSRYLKVFTAVFALSFSCTHSNIEKGNTSLVLGDYIMAKEFFGAELRKHPESFDARMGMGKALLQQAVSLNDDTLCWRQALINLEAARTIKPDEDILPLISECWLEYARILLIQRDTVRALTALSRSIEYDPRSVDPVNLAAIIYYHMGNEDKSEILFKKSIGIDSTSPSAYFNLGMIYLQNGDIPAAHGFLLNALKYAPEDKDILYWFALSEKKIRETTGQ